jgi:hypothetical protein
MQHNSQAFLSLYETFTGHPDSIGAHLNGRLGALSADDPMLVATGTDVVLFPRGGREARSCNFRLGMRGFKELTAISHLGVAVPYLARLRELGFDGWQHDAMRLADEVRSLRTVNSHAFWRDEIATEAFAGREEGIAAMTDYACLATLMALERALADPASLTFPMLRNHWLDTGEAGPFPIGMNDMMAATFALVFLDTAYRMIGWLREQDVAWERLMVLISGKAGRPTAGLTWQTNSMCHLLWQASDRRLPPERVYIAPHGPELVLAELDTREGARDTEARFRELWFRSRASVEMGRLMFADYPAFDRAITEAPVIDPETQEASELPRVRSLDDRRAIITRLRFVMEDPGQQLANAGSQFVVDQLCANGNDPRAARIPGFDNVDYQAALVSLAASSKKTCSPG